MTSPRRPRIRCAAVVVSACLLAGCGGLSGKPAAPAQSLGSGAGAPTLVQVAALLARHSRAALSRSAPAFLTDVDTAPPANGFRQRQQAQIANLAQVPLRSWRYAVSAPVTDASTSAGAAKRLGAAVLIVHLSLFYALLFVDAHPTSHELWWTFVQRRGRVYVAGDDDMADLGGASWTGPWDYGPILAARGTTSLVLGHPQDSARLTPLATVVDAAVPIVTGVWGTQWARQVAVLVPTSDREFDALSGQGSGFTDISAVAVSDGSDPVGGVPLGQRVVLSLHALANLTPAGLRILVQHEVTHIATAAGTGPVSPRWLVEGLAEYVGNLGSAQPVAVTASELRSEVAVGRLAAALPADAEFAPGSARLAQVYQESWLACRLIAVRAGQAALVRLYRLVGGSRDTGARAVEAALHQVVHESTASFTTRWRTYLTDQLG